MDHLVGEPCDPQAAADDAYPFPSEISLTFTHGHHVAMHLAVDAQAISETQLAANSRAFADQAADRGLLLELEPHDLDPSHSPKLAAHSLAMCVARTAPEPSSTLT